MDPEGCGKRRYTAMTGEVGVAPETCVAFFSRREAVEHIVEQLSLSVEERENLALDGRVFRGTFYALVEAHNVPVFTQGLGFCDKCIEAEVQ